MTDDETLLQMAERHARAGEHVQAFTIFQRLANRGNAIAEARLGDCYYTATGTEKDAGKATFWFEKSAMQGNAEGQYGLGRSYYGSRSAVQNYARAVYWFTKAAEQGHAAAQ